MRYPAAEHVSKREWVVLGVLLFGLALSVGLIVGVLAGIVVRALSN